MADATITRNVNYTWNNGATIVGNAVKTSARLAHADSVRAFNNTQTITITSSPVIGGEAINLIDVDPTNDYMLMITNKSQGTITLPVNLFVQYGAGNSDFVNCGRIYPGESWGPVRMPGTSTYPKIYALSTTTAVDVEVICGEAKRAA